ncbi:MAG: hypothetical protein NTY98_07540, partial [Verrucomicrobia bacterium]|nr:hypothetical protein [Verrucomicrobiota bacterium]
AKGYAKVGRCQIKHHPASRKRCGIFCAQIPGSKLRCGVNVQTIAGARNVLSLTNDCVRLLMEEKRHHVVLEPAADPVATSAAYFSHSGEIASA